MSTPPVIPQKHLPPTAPVATPPRNPWGGLAIDFLIAVGVMLAVMLSGMVGWGVVQGVKTGSKNPAAAANPDALAQAIGEPSAVLMMVISSVGMAGAALAVYYFRRRATPAERQVSNAAASQPRTWVEAIGLGVMLFLVGAVLMWGLEKLGHRPNPTNLKMVEALMAQSPALLVMLVVVMAPVFEELLFRRGFFGRFWAANKPMVGMLVSSLLFALAHEVPGTTGSPFGTTLILLLFYAGMGASMAWIYQRTKTLWAPIATHATNNLLGVGMMLAGYAG